MALKDEFRSQGNYLFKYRGFLPVLILVPALAVYVFHEYNNDGIPGKWDDIIKFGALLVSIVGLLIRSHVIGHVAPNTSGRNTNEGQVADVVNTTGWYSLVRHPLYVGNFFMWLAPAIWTQNIWFIAFFIVLYYLYYERIMFAEESYLIDKFGDRYTKWASERPAFMPKLSGYVAPDTKLNWRKILRQERTGFMAIFAVFWLFDICGQFAVNGMSNIDLNFWHIAFVISLVIFLILKALKRKPILQDRI